MAEIIRFQFRRGTAAEWAAANPVLADGEPGVERDTGKQKIGDGVRAWNALPYTATKGDPGPAGVADDASVKTLVEAPGSATRAALNATYVRFEDEDGNPLPTRNVVIKVDSASGEIIDIVSEA